MGRAATTVLLCHPYNPLGRAYDREELLALADVVEAAGARVISDEIHAPLTYGRTHIPYASVSDAAAAHTISLVSASKAFNLPGLKAAAVITHSDADERAWQELPYAATHGVSTLGLIATVAAYDHGKPWLDHVMAHLDGNRRLLAELVAEQLPGVGYVIPEATYLGWLDCQALPAEVSSSPVDFFLREAGVALNDGATFGNAGRGYVRLNFATPTPVLREIVERMGAAVSRL
jgi:cystathionine beta-lyase